MSVSGYACIAAAQGDLHRLPVRSIGAALNQRIDSVCRMRRIADRRQRPPTGLCQISDHETQRDDVRLDRLSLARRHLRDQPVPARKEQPALVGQRDVRAASTAHPEVLSQLVNRRAESRG